MWDQNYAYSELPDDAETAEEIEFIHRVLDLEEGSIVLDLCCGQGRHSLALANMGYSVIGLDSSRSLLELVEKDKLHEGKSRLWLVEGDMRNIPLRAETCDAIINLFTSFGFFDDADNLRVLETAASALKPGGKLLIDYWNPYMAVQLDGTRNWWWITDNLLSLAEARYDFSTGRMRDRRTLINVEKSTVEDMTRELRFYMLPELEKMLEQAGFHILEVYGDVDEREYDGVSRRLITISGKVK